MSKGLAVVGMSGGVDSSVAAFLLKEQGYDVAGVTLLLWQDGDFDESVCGGLAAVDDSRRVCDMLGIPHHTLDFRDEFKQNVIVKFTDEYLNGRTPNPCILCNSRVK